MTLSLWPFFILLTLLALCFIAYPLWINRRFMRRRLMKGDDKPTRFSPSTSRREQNLALYKARLAEIASDQQAGRITDEVGQQLQEEAGLILLSDLDTEETTSPSQPAQGLRRVVLLSLLLVPLSAFFMYQHWGAYEDLAKAGERQEIIAAAGDSPAEQMNTLLNQLRERLQTQPDNLEGWRMLGTMSMHLERYEQAAWAFEQLAGKLETASADLAANKADSAAAWGLAAQAQYFNADARFNDRVMQRIAQALKLNPDEINALGLLGIRAFQSGDYQAAADYWTRITTIAPDHPQIASIQQSIAEARQRGNLPVPVEAAVATESADATAQAVANTEAGPSLKVSVTLGAAYAGKTPADATLFVYARAVTGPPMPLAVARLRADQLPVTVTLDDSMAMRPDLRLSQFDPVKLTARISASGLAMPASGDWIGESGPIHHAEANALIQLTIDRQLP